MALRPDIIANYRPEGMADVVSRFRNSLLSLEGKDAQSLATNRAVQANELLRLQTIGEGQQNQERDQKARLLSLAMFANDVEPDIAAGDLASITAKTKARIPQLASEGKIPDDSTELLKMLENPHLTDDQKLREAKRLSDQTLATARRFGVMDTNARMQAFNELTSGLTPEQVEQARRIELGIDPRAVGSSAITLTNMGQPAVNAVAETESIVSGAKERGELAAQYEIKPAIQSAIARAEAEAKSRGETNISLVKAKAAMPGLIEVADKLKALSDVATYTKGGQAFDLLSKELGFGATEGGTARVKITSIVDNQVLPLLRDTFGAAFTAAEGERLRATLIDADSTPEAKKATLDAFIEQKMRDIQTKESELGIGANGSPTIDQRKQRLDALRQKAGL